MTGLLLVTITQNILAFSQTQRRMNIAKSRQVTAALSLLAMRQIGCVVRLPFAEVKNFESPLILEMRPENTYSVCLQLKLKYRITDVTSFY